MASRPVPSPPVVICRMSGQRISKFLIIEDSEGSASLAI
jgi:hypothetical protein